MKSTGVFIPEGQSITDFRCGEITIIPKSPVRLQGATWAGMDQAVRAARLDYAESRGYGLYPIRWRGQK